MHIPSYPNISEHWIENWHNKLAEYDLEPAEYVHWVDSRLYKGRELDTQESIQMLEQDFILAKNGLQGPKNKTWCD